MLRLATRDQADRDYFERRLAPKFAMRRDNGILADRAAYVDNLKINGPRRTVIESVSVLDPCRAIVACIVAMGAHNYANLRIFIQEHEGGERQMLAWANEPEPDQ